jgi:integrase
MIQFSQDGLWLRYAEWLKKKLADSSIKNELKLLSYCGFDIIEQTEDRIIEDRVLAVESGRGWHKPTTYKLRTYLKKFYYWLYEWEKIKSGRTPYQRFFATKGPRPEPRWLIDEDIQKMIGNPFMSVRDSLLVRLTYYSGCRRSEICALNVDDFDPKTETLHIRHGKRDKWGHVKIDSGTASLLKSYIVT